jgi:hypothetical protein
MSNIVELTFVSSKTYPDPFNEIELDVEFADPQGQKRRIPAFWAGENTWRVRYAPAIAGRHLYRLACSDPANTSLHGQTGNLEVKVVPENPLLSHLHVAENGRYLERADGSPFFWLGDTWWLSLCSRKGWGLREFTKLARDRVEKGFTVIQIVAGLYPDLPPFDSRGFNEAGYPWEAEYKRINPAYFDMADLRIERLVQEGLVPCLVAAWGYHLPWLGVERMKKHWRYLIARWAVHPVVWCLAGEAAMPYYLSKNRAEDAAFQKQGWTEIGHYVRSIDPYHHPVTIHPSASCGHETIDDVSILDIDMLGTGHGDWQSASSNVDTVNREYERQPAKPILNGEVCYEGHMQTCWHGVQRFMFWSNILSGAAGHTYGAGGIWQMNTREQPHGPSPQGGTYENTPWDEAAQFPGARHLGLGKALLMCYRWWCFEPHQEWVEPGWETANYMLPYAAGIPGQVRMIYIPARVYQWQGPLIKDLEESVTYRGFYFDPLTGEEYDLGTVTRDEGGTWQAPWVPLAQDWILVLERLYK